MLFRSIVTLAAGAAAVSALGPLPTEIGFLVNQVAELMQDTPYYPQLSQAAQSLISGYKLPGQQAQDEKIVSSLLSALSSQNVPSQATSIAGSVISVLEGDGDSSSDKLNSLVSSVVLELRNPAVNTQIASIVDKLVGLLEQARIVAPEMFADSPSEPTPTSTRASTSSKNTSTKSTRTDTSASSPTSKSSSSPLSSNGTSKDSQASPSSESSSESTSESTSSKTNGAQSMKPLFGYLSMGVAAGVVASFF
ncbi:hypothetical protein GGI01_003329 [Coemansia sp. RSA 376]|nr:hypothetical protein GGI01_003329 [Coemansia sp. RSA 376]